MVCCSGALEILLLVEYPALSVLYITRSSRLPIIDRLMSYSRHLESGVGLKDSFVFQVQIGNFSIHYRHLGTAYRRYCLFGTNQLFFNLQRPFSGIMGSFTECTYNLDILQAYSLNSDI